MESVAVADAAAAVGFVGRLLAARFEAPADCFAGAAVPDEPEVFTVDDDAAVSSTEAVFLVEAEDAFFVEAEVVFFVEAEDAFLVAAEDASVFFVARFADA